jgi:radical SAM protein with 4Fe4S-binding SPASM domain
MYISLKEDTLIRLNPGGAELFAKSCKPARLKNEAVEIIEMINDGKDENFIRNEISKKYGDTENVTKEMAREFLNQLRVRGYVSVGEKHSKKNIICTGSKNCWIPLGISLELTRACNLKCRHCYAEAGAKQEKEASAEEMIDALKRLRTAGVWSLNITGGEPLLNPKIFDILDFAYKNFRTVLLTNGYALDEEVAQKLSKYKEMAVQVSIDGSDAKTHDYIRGVDGSFDKVVRATEMLSKSGIRVIVAMAVTNFNIDQMGDTIKLSLEKGAVRFRPSPIVPSGRAKGLHWELSKENMEKFKAMVKEYYEKYKGKILVDPGDTIITEEQRNAIESMKNCGAGYRLAAISPNGDVRPCQGMPNEVFCQGNIYKQSIEEVFGSKMSRFLYDIQAPKKGTCGNCEYTQNCGSCIALAYSVASESNPSCGWLKNTTNELEKQCHEV